MARRFVIFLMLITFFLAPFIAKQVNAELNEDPDPSKIFSGLGYVRGYEDQGCEWRVPFQHKGSVTFGEHTFLYFKCLHGAYNAWYVYLKVEPDGTFEPVTFAYPEISAEKSGSQIIGMNTTRSLCNPEHDEDNWTISTMCKGRGIGDVATYGFWKLNVVDIELWLSEKPKRKFTEFLLLKFQIDSTEDEQKNPVTLLDFSSDEIGVETHD